MQESRRMPFSKVDSDIGEMEGYVIKFVGVEVDLENWREHVEADADEGGQEDNGGDDLGKEEEPIPNPASAHGEDPHLINAYAKFKLIDPRTGQPIEVAYIKDQRGRLLGFDSFSKRDGAESGSDDGLHGVDAAGDEKAPAHDGECTFHIVPGETTSVTAYAIYRGLKKEDDGEGSVREDVLYYTPVIPLLGFGNEKR